MLKNMRGGAIACLLLSGLWLAAAQDVCVGLPVQVHVFPGNITATAQPQYGFLAQFSAEPAADEPLAPLILAEPAEACAPLAAVPPGSVVLVVRGNCSFVEKAAAVSDAGGIAMLLYNNATGCITMGGDRNSTGPSAAGAATAISVDHNFGAQLAVGLAMGRHASVQIIPVHIAKFDPSALVLWLIAVATLTGGSIWAGRDYRAAKRQAGDLQQEPSAQQSIGGEESVDVTAQAAVGFVLLASAMLLLMFFMLNAAFFYLLLGLFCLGSTQSMAIWLTALLEPCLPGLRGRTVDLPWLGHTPALCLLTVPVAAGCALAWAVLRNTWSGSWILQDVLGVSLMLLVLRSLRLTSMRVACVLLPLCFAYDVFFVFLEPLIFGGPSVMVEVARGGSSKEYIPMLLRIPRFTNRELGGYSMLGFGDVILPGLLVAYTRRLDIDLNLRGCRGLSYFSPTVASYGLGLVLTYVALALEWGGNQGQPALLYLVPCTLGCVCVVACVRGELAMLFSSRKWSVRDVLDHDSDPGGGDAHLDDNLESQLSDSEAARLLEHHDKPRTNSYRI